MGEQNYIPPIVPTPKDITDIGFDKSLRREFNKNPREKGQINGGRLGDQFAIIDGNLVLKNNDRVIMVIGKQEDGSFGIVVKDENGIDRIIIGEIK